jgi:hypothetical protein
LILREIPPEAPSFLGDLGFALSLLNRCYQEIIDVTGFEA